MVWHQAVSENADAGLTAVLREQIEIDTPVSFGLFGCGRRFGGRFRVGLRVGEIRAGRAGLSVAYFAVVAWRENFSQSFCGRGCPLLDDFPWLTTFRKMGLVAGMQIVGTAGSGKFDECRR